MWFLLCLKQVYAYAWGGNENYPYKDEKLADKTCVIVVCIVDKFEWDLKFELA